MEDKKIVELYWARNEDAITQTSVKYGGMMHATSKSIVGSHEDAEECVNDAYLAAWNSMPENRPTYLGGYMARIIRNISLNRYDRNHAAKRQGVQVVFEELEGCLTDYNTPEEEYEQGCLKEVLDNFLESLDEQKRVIFLRRYFYTDSIAEIAQRMQMSEGKIKSILFRLRGQLAATLKEAGV
ncbi:MAG: sigma-70 family RNA polymerase sigma factor [Clostridia bacterium]|nr:sigma-70 family RNA polymerase sigma factor [Clostridia bacterium]MBO7297097.1 sigma-70 family RNA polymerase sigma factor [Clostridia bacterium]